MKVVVVAVLPVPLTLWNSWKSWNFFVRRCPEKQICHENQELHKKWEYVNVLKCLSGAFVAS